MPRLVCGGVASCRAIYSLLNYSIHTIVSSPRSSRPITCQSISSLGRLQANDLTDVTFLLGGYCAA